MHLKQPALSFMRLILTLLAICSLLNNEEINAQDLDPRAYARIPVNVTIIIAGFSYSQGGVVTDPTVPLEDLHAKIGSPSLGVGHSFSLFRRTAQVSAAMPYALGDISAIVGGAQQSITRSGISDMRLRFSMLLLGGPASSPGEPAKSVRKTILGTSLSVIAPTGQYFPEKLINLGTSRWAFKPELALSQPIGKRWLIDAYSGLWLFSKNDSFYPGTKVRKQDPLGSFQCHISYNIQTLMWAALDMTFYTGGNSSVDGVKMNDRQSNSRIGATIVLPVGKHNSLKIAFSKGAIIRFGADFSTLSLGWQTSFFRKPVKTVPQSS
jgi:hypothetical protein